MRRAVVFSFAAEFGATVSMVATIKLAAILWGDQGFAEWLVVRRILAFVLPVTTMGLDIALARALAQAQARGDADDPRAFLMAAVILGVAVQVGVLTSVFVFREQAAQLLFGSRLYSNLVLPICLLCSGYGLYILLYAYFRGRMRFMEANLAHVLAYGVVPLAVMLLIGTSVSATVTWLGAVILAFCVIFLSAILAGGSPGRSVWAHVRPLSRLGSSRMVGVVLLMGLALAPTSYAAWHGDIVQAGYVAFGTSIIGIAGSLCAPIGVTLLPVASALAGSGRMSELVHDVRRLEWCIIAVAGAIALLMPLVAPSLSELFLGSRRQDLVSVLSIAGVGAGPFVYFVCARSIVDAYFDRALNTRNAMVSCGAFVLAIFVLAALGFSASVAAVGGYTVALWVLAVLTALAVRRALPSQRRIV